MNVEFLNEKDFDDALHNGRHATIREDFSEDDGDVEIEIIERLVEEARPAYPEELFYVSYNIWDVPFFYIEMKEEILSLDMLNFLKEFLSRHAPDHAFLISLDAVNIEELLEFQRGRMFMNLREIVVEDSARGLWEEKIGTGPVLE